MDQSDLTITNNTISNSTEGIRIYRDRGSTIVGNTIHSNDMGIFLRTMDDGQFTDEATSLSFNEIFGNDWGISCLGNSTNLSLEGNTFSNKRINNTQGMFREEREVMFHLLNGTAKVSVNISSGEVLVFQGNVSEHSHYTRINLPVMVQRTGDEEETFDIFKAEFDSGGSNVTREFNIYVTSEHTIEFPAIP